MTSARVIRLGLLVALTAACGGGYGASGGAGGGYGGGTGGTGGGTPPPSGPNVLAVTVDGANCSGGSYPNKPCVRATICLPGSSACMDVGDLLLDTGSFGLRIFHEVLPFSLPLVTSGAGTLAECVKYLDGTSHWGPVAMADVTLGGEPAIRIPIQVIDSTFGPPPTQCPTPEASAAGAGFAGILGVGPFAEDCGPACASVSANGLYFQCAGGSCSGTTVPIASQVPNPVARLPADNNGVLVELPAVPLGGQLSAAGSLVLGIDTRANNSSAGATAYPGDPATGDIRTSFSGTAGAGFLDTGSNGLFFAPPSSGALPTCTPPEAAWYCPVHPTAFVATNAGSSGTPSGQVSFTIGFAAGLLGNGNSVFPDIGGPLPPSSGFDFGLPFFFGQRVFSGIDGRSSGLGVGPLDAY